MRLLRRLSGLIDALNDRIGAAIRWLALIMVLVGAFNAIARYLTRYTGVALSSNAYLDLQWYFFSLIFLLGAAFPSRRTAGVLGAIALPLVVVALATVRAKLG